MPFEELKRARKEHWPTSLAKVIKKALSISELLTERDQADSVRVLRQAKAATHRVFDPATKQLIEVRDHKTRLAAVTMELAYTEGRPIERQMSLSGKFEDLAAMQERLKHSPAFQRIMAQESLQSGQNVTNRERPPQGSSGESEPAPGSRKVESHSPNPCPGWSAAWRCS
jgi:hypothetical protein